MFMTRKVVRQLSICLFSSHCFFKATVEVSDSFSGVPNVARQEDHPEFKDIPDYETFAMTPIDLSSAAEKKKLEAILAWGEYGLEGDLPGPCLDGKEFK